MDPAISDEAAIAATRAWVEGVVVRLNLCPFAAPFVRRGQLRCAVSRATTRDGVLAALREELERLMASDEAEIATTLLILPDAFPDFLAYNAFLPAADKLLRRMDLEGTVQIASFHPDYRFAGADPEDFAHHTNRSPFPMLHLLREAQVAWAVDTHPDVEGIPEANVARLRGMSDAERAEVVRLACPFSSRRPTPP